MHFSGVFTKNMVQKNRLLITLAVILSF